MKRLSIVYLIFAIVHIDTHGAMSKENAETYLIESLDALCLEAQRSIEDGVAKITESNPNPKQAIGIFLKELDQKFKPSFIEKYKAIQEQIEKSDLPPWETQPIAQKKAEEIYDALIAKLRKKYLTPKEGCVIL
jgi:hypothetical protein